MKKIIAGALFISLTTALFAQTKQAPIKSNPSEIKLVQEATKNNVIGNIPYKKYILPNGLTVVIHEDHSDPICYVDVTYHVGSSREEIGRSGFAHFFEHMMFQGSDNVADEEHFKTVSEAGGTLNGSTNTDRTNYFETLPSNNLEVALWLEADRMGFLLDAVTQQKFEVQRATVKNERGQNYDNRPYGLVGEKIGRSLFPYGHGYNWSTIGDLVDLDRVDVNDLKSFFMRWYGPNNAVLTIAGDVNTEQALKLAEKYFAPIPRGPEVTNMAKTPAVVDKDRYISYEDNVRFPMLSMNFPTVPNRDADEPALDVLSNVLGGTTNSLLYQKFVKSQLAVNATAQHPARELAGWFNITVLPMPGKGLAETEKMVRDILVEFEKTGVTQTDIDRFVSTYESGIIDNLSSVQGKGSLMAANQTFTGDPNYLITELAAYKKLTPADIIRVFNKYVKGKPAVILSVVPKGKKDLIAAPDNYSPKETNPNDADHAEYKGLVYNKAKDIFDRSKKPSAGPSPVVKVPDYWTDNKPNGLKVIGVQSDEVPMIHLQLTVAAGHRMETHGKAGVANLLADMMGESTEKYTTEQKDEELEKLGSEIFISANDENITVNIASQVKNIDATLKIAEEVLFHPKFDKEDFDRVKNQKLQVIANQVTQPKTIADNVFAKLLYGKESIMSVPAIGTEQTVASITLDDVKNYYKNNFKPNITSLVVVGNTTKETIMPKLAFLNTWKGVAKDKLEANTAIPSATEKTKIYLIDKEKAPQSEIRIGYLAMPFDATGDFYKSKIMNFALGGSFNSRINLNLREKKGFTYGATSTFKGGKFAGPFVAAAGVKGNSTDSSVVEFMKEMKGYYEQGITNEELDFTKKSLGSKDALSYETAFQKAGFLKLILDYNLPKTYVDEQAKILNNITKEELDALAKSKLKTDKMAIVVVGDKKELKDKLLKLGYEVVEMDSNGNPLSTPTDGSRKEGY